MNDVDEVKGTNRTSSQANIREEELKN